MFHALCRNCADCLIGGTSSQRSLPAWRQAYRAVEHTFSKQQCKNSGVLRKFPKEIEDFASLYITLQQKRHAADYDPHAQFLKTDVDVLINAAEATLKAFSRVQIKDRRAFAAWSAMKHRKD